MGIRGRGFRVAARSGWGKAVSTWRVPRGVLPLGSGALLMILAAVGYGSASDDTRSQSGAAMPSTAQGFLRRNCLACHNRTNPSGKLDLTTAFRPADSTNFNLWVKVV